jgi:uncharacterized protein (TIGR02246 family)
MSSRTKRAIVHLTLLLAGSSGACIETRSVDISQDTKQVEAAAQRIWSAVSRNDAAGIVAEYAEDSIIFPPNEPMVQGKPAVTKYLGELLGAVSFRDATGTIADIRVSGDLAIETGHYAWTIVPAGGAPMSDKGKYVHVFARTPDGTWKVIRYFSNSDVPPPTLSPAP